MLQLATVGVKQNKIMNISKSKLLTALDEVGGAPLFKGAPVYLLKGQSIDTNKMETLTEVIKRVFIAGQDSKVR